MEKQSETMTQWIVAIFSVFGAFFLCGIGGSLIASIFGIWETPVAGFFAAFSVVAMAYLAMPSHKKEVAIGTFIIGCFLAWIILEPSHYPESYELRAYQATHLPLLITAAGGLVALIICLAPMRTNKENA